MIRRIEATENVYKPAEDSFLIADQIPYCTSKRTLDMGTGCGLLALISADTAQEVIGTDINPSAVRCAKKNAELNGLDHKIDVLAGNLFDPIETEKRFDLVTFNPPYLPNSGTSTDGDYLQYAWNGGKDGRLVTDRFLDQVPRFLQKGGNLLLVQSSLSGIQPTINKLHRNNFKVETVASKHIHFEDIVVLRCQRG
jgi:release factor glutamine methyltransferase